MNTPRADNPDRIKCRHNWPWWEPYVFTAGVLAAFVVFFIACGIFGSALDRFPFGWTIWLALFTAAAVADLLRRSSRSYSLIWPLLLSMFFGAAAIAYRTRPDRWFGVWHGALAILFLCSAVKSGVLQHRMKKEGLARLDRAGETLRHEVGHGDIPMPSSNQPLNPTENRPSS